MSLKEKCINTWNTFKQRKYCVPIGIMVVGSIIGIIGALTAIYPVYIVGLAIGFIGMGVSFYYNREKFLNLRESRRYNYELF